MNHKRCVMVFGVYDDGAYACSNPPPGPCRRRV